MRFPLLPALLALAVITTGCTTAKKAYHRASEDLKTSVKLYNESLKAGDVDAAMAFIPAPDRPAFMDAYAKTFKDIRFTDVRTGPIEFPENASEATVTVTRTYYRMDELTEKSETLNQTWLWKAKELRWYLKWTGKP